MLVGSGVENHIGMERLKNFIHAEVVANACNKRHEIQAFAILHRKLLLDFVGIIFVDIDNDNLLRIVLRNLAHEFRAYASSRTRNQNCLAGQILLYLLEGYLDLLASEKVFDSDFADKLTCNLAVLDLIYLGREKDGNAGFIA